MGRRRARRSRRRRRRQSRQRRRWWRPPCWRAGRCRGRCCRTGSTGGGSGSGPPTGTCRCARTAERGGRTGRHVKAAEAAGSVSRQSWLLGTAASCHSPGPCASCRVLARLRRHCIAAASRSVPRAAAPAAHLDAVLLSVGRGEHGSRRRQRRARRRRPRHVALAAGLPLRVVAPAAGGALPVARHRRARGGGHAAAGGRAVAGVRGRRRGAVARGGSAVAGVAAVARGGAIGGCGRGGGAACRHQGVLGGAVGGAAAHVALVGEAAAA